MSYSDCVVLMMVMVMVMVMAMTIAMTIAMLIHARFSAICQVWTASLRYTLQH